MQKPDHDQTRLFNELEFPWLGELNGIAAEICVTLHDKESSYRGSWQKRGGIGAFMMLARKWDRIESISKSMPGCPYDIFRAVELDAGEISDDIRDLIGYLLLVLSKIQADRKVEP